MTEQNPLRHYDVLGMICINKEQLEAIHRPLPSLEPTARLKEGLSGLEGTEGMLVRIEHRKPYKLGYVLNLLEDGNSKWRNDKKK